MQLQLALVCDHVEETPEGKLDLKGVFHDLAAPGFPAKHDMFSRAGGGVGPIRPGKIRLPGRSPGSLRSIHDDHTGALRRGPTRSRAPACTHADHHALAGRGLPRGRPVPVSDTGEGPDPPRSLTLPDGGGADGGCAGVNSRGAGADVHLAHADRVCIVLLGGIGDVVHGLPVAMALKRDRPARQMVWVAQPAPAQLLEHHPAIDEIVVLQPKTGLRTFKTLWSAFRGNPCEVTLNMQRYAKTLLPTYLSGASVRVGLAPSRTRDGVRFINTVHTPEGPWRHTQDLFLEFPRYGGHRSAQPVAVGSHSFRRRGEGGCRVLRSSRGSAGGRAGARKRPTQRRIGRSIATPPWLTHWRRISAIPCCSWGGREMPTRRPRASSWIRDAERPSGASPIRCGRLIWSIRGCDSGDQPRHGRASYRPRPQRTGGGSFRAYQPLVIVYLLHDKGGAV